MVNNARNYGDIGLYTPFMQTIIVKGTASRYI